ncbi:MAG: hypothetical protein NTX61_03790 [Bacteroidetes bacterium]|nr:hypothetical protein [Bacteroidota bacterium]
MSNSPIDNDLIERYLLGKLTDAEIRDFLIRVDDDREFARKFRLIKMFPEMMSETGRMEFEKKQAEALAVEAEKKSRRFPKRRHLVWAFVSFIALIGIALFFIISGTDHQKGNVVGKENIALTTKMVKPVAVPVKDSLKEKTQQPQQPEKKEIMEITGGAVQKAIDLLTPAEGVTFSKKEMILFNWIQKTDSFTRFYIFSELNDHVVLWRGIRPGTREYKVPGNTLYPGKFYWYVGTKEKRRTFIISE